MEEHKKELYIPVNIPESRAKDYFAGYGAKEFVITLCSFIIAMIIAIILYTTTEQILFAGIIGIGIVGLTVIIVKRDKFDESMIDQMKIIRKFSKAQKQYEYEYYNIYEKNGMEE